MQLPLTFQQQWLWSLLREHPEWNCAVAYAFRIRGELRVECLRASLAEVIRRHSALHTRIVVAGGTPMQETDDPQAGRFMLETLTGDTEGEIDAQARRKFAEFADRITDPAVGPLLRVSLLQLSGQEHWLFLALHRLTADCFSADQIIRELWCFYRAYVQGSPSPFPTDPPQYGDYAIWQESTSALWRERHEVYWKGRLNGAMNVRWPVDQPSGLPGRGTIARMSTWFGEEVGSGLQEFARKARTLSATAMLAVYVAVLWKWCRQPDFVVPFNIAGRQAEHRHMVGYFSHILYLRLALTGQETFTELANRISNEFFKALSHQDFGRMALEAPHLLAGTFFQWVTWHPQASLDGVQEDKATDVSVERLALRDFGDGLSALPAGMVEVDITFFDTPKGLYASGLYRADLFRATTLERLMGDLRTAAGVFVRNPAAPIASLR